MTRPGGAGSSTSGPTPPEQRDLSAEHPEKVAALEGALAAHDAEQSPSISTAKAIDKDLSVPEAADDEYIYWSN